MPVEFPLYNTVYILFTEWPHSTTFMCAGRQSECCSSASQEQSWNRSPHKGTFVSHVCSAHIQIN